jgi:hypothetical protein
MAGEIKRLIDTIIKERAKGNPTIEMTTKIKMQLKGISADQYTAGSPDDAAIIGKLRDIAKEFGLTLK